MDEALRRTSLYEAHRALGGRMVAFAGWEMPVQYDATGPTAEHLAVRAAAGLFDIDHMGQLRISGPDAVPFLNYLQTADAGRVPPLGAQYGLLTYADGGTADDLFLYRLDDAWWAVVNAANRTKDLAWLQAHASDFEVTLADISDDIGMLALQGPKAAAILQRVTDVDLAKLPYHFCTWGMVAGARALIGATGYTGEFGYELCCPSSAAVDVWRALLEAGRADGLLPCGLAARDSLRLEAALPLYGHELAADIDPFTAGLGSFVHFDKGDFIGRDALLKIKLEGPSRKVAGFEMQEPSVPREGYPVLAAGAVAGRVTSGMKSPTTGRFLGMALLAADAARPGTALDIVIRDRPRKAVVVKRPFYLPAYRRQR